MNVYLKQWVGRLLLWCCLLMAFSCQSEEKVVDGLPCRLTGDGKWGIVSTDGKHMLVPYALEDKPSCVVNGMFVLPTDEGLFHLFHVNNPYEPVSSRRFYRIGYFFEDVTLAQETKESPFLFIDKTGKTVFSTEQVRLCQIELMCNFSEGRALFVTKEGKYGYLDTQGHIVIPPIYDYAHSFKEGIALVGQSDGKGHMAYQLIDLNGSIRSFVQVSNGVLDEAMGDGLLLCKDSDGHCYYLNKQSEPVLYLPEEIDECTSFLHGMAAFKAKDKVGIIDDKGKVLVAPTYDEGYVAGEDRVILSLEGKYALADADGVLKSAMQYDSIGRFYSSGMTVARKDGIYHWMNRKGELEDACWDLIAEEAEACQEIPQIFFRQYEMKTEQSEEKVEAPVEELKKQSEKRSINRNAWKEIAKQSPFYEEMKRVISGELEESDAENRRLILNYVEHFRTSYTTKDIDFLEQLFSENALIIVGTVIKSLPQSEVDYLPQNQVVYNVKSKRQYLDRLREVFRTNQEIEVGFEEFKIMRHPTKEGIYGVTLRQHYSSDRYSDDGYLFLLWDFQDKMAPKIHVRTWQPTLQEDQTLLPKNKVFNIRNFNLQ